jgi:crotonobetainyl-CoA:carnitine CoA-transferase CaiB-like acyl-CoA transferase
MEGPLSGVTILEVAQWWFVPASAAVLNDWGAEVIKVEHPVQGDGQRGLAAVGFKSSEGNVDFMMQQSNRGKKSVGIDLAHPKGREILDRLVERADVFLTNFLPDARERLQIEVEHIRSKNPEIVYVRGSGQGPLGPDAHKGGYDATAFWSRGGIADALTPPDREIPIMQRAAFGDSIGAMSLAGGIAAALLKRERTGEPSVVDVSLLSTAMWVLAPDVVASKLVDPKVGIPRPGGDRTLNPNPVGNAYKTRDGRWLLLMMLQADKDWADFCRHIDRSDMIDDERFRDFAARFQNRQECIRQIDAEFAKYTLAEWQQKLQTMTGPWAPMQSPEELHDDPQVIANGYLAEVDRGDGHPFKLVANPVQFDQTPVTLSASPEMGQHTEEVLLEHGMSWDEITACKEAGAIN